jgi:glycosyltransferase involved in cell wall biosynthesis
MGPVFTQSGLGSAARAHYSCLIAAGFTVSCIPILDGHESHPVVDFEFKSYEFSANENVTLIIYQNHHAFNGFIEKYADIFFLKNIVKRIAFWVWELSEFQEQWLIHVKYLDEIWVPSEFVKSSLSKMIHLPIKVIPYSIDVSSFSDTSFREEFFIEKNNFVFGYIFDASSYVERKNPMALIKAFSKLVSTDRNVHLILKISHIEHFYLYLEENKVNIENFANIHLLSTNLTHKEILGFLKEIDCYVSPHRSEGFGLTIAEALSLGKIVIATDYSGSVDFLNIHNGFPVNFVLKKILTTLGPYLEGNEWADISDTHLIDTMKFVVNNKKDADIKSNYAKETVKNNLSNKNISLLIKKILHS